MHKYKLDVTLFAIIEVEARTQRDAILLLRALPVFLDDDVKANFGVWKNGDPVLGSVAMDVDGPDVIEIDGRAV